MHHLPPGSIQALPKDGAQLLEAETVIWRRNGAANGTCLVGGCSIDERCLSPGFILYVPMFVWQLHVGLCCVHLCAMHSTPHLLLQLSVHMWVTAVPVSMLFCLSLCKQEAPDPRTLQSPSLALLGPSADRCACSVPG